MTFTVSITSQGQMSIPARLRRKLGFEKSGKVLVTEQNGTLVIEPIKDFLELGGSLKTHKKPLSSKKVHEFVARSFAKGYAKKMQ